MFKDKTRNDCQLRIQERWFELGGNRDGSLTMFEEHEAKIWGSGT